MSQPTIEQIERLPKWAQSHIRQLDRQRQDATTALKRFQDSDKPTRVSYEQGRYLDGEFQFFVRHLDTHQMQFICNGVSLVVRLPDDDEAGRGIELSWGPEGSRGMGDLCFTPTAYQQARITNLAYQPREYESLMQRKKQADEKKKKKTT
jgi:hypothetical protein